MEAGAPAAQGLAWWLTAPAVLAAAGVLLLAYVRGWRRLHGIAPRLVLTVRLAAIVTGLGLICAALVWPLPMLSQGSVLARMAQKVAIALTGAPLVWLACPFHVCAWGAPSPLRRRITRALLRPSRLSALLRTLYHPFAIWFLYLCAVASWDDPTFVNWSMAAPWRQQGSLLVLLAASLLFWQQITLCGPSRLGRAPLLARFAMLLGVEIPNVAAGITIAFQSAPLYDHYARLDKVGALAGSMGLLGQQSLAGALTWVFGSLVYVFSIVMVVNEVFRREGMDRSHPLANWDDESRFIAPGLEERLNESSRERHNWRNH